MVLSNRKLKHPFILDAHGNSVAKVCLETGVSLEILDFPGSLGDLIDKYAYQLGEIMHAMETTSLGKITFKLESNDSKLTAKDHFNLKMLQEMHPRSDQVGRCLDCSLEKNWFQGEGFEWIQTQLARSSSAKDYSYTHLLMKIKAIIGMGGCVRAMMPRHSELLSRLLKQNALVLQERYTQLMTKILHTKFCSSATRGRRERMPIIEGKPLSHYPLLRVQLIDGRSKQLGFGDIYHVDGMRELRMQADAPSIIEKYQQLERECGRQGMLRLGQDVVDCFRPGLLGESSMTLMPSAFAKTQLITKLKRHRYHHGSGLNRWEVYGNYANSAYDENMPVAGGLSGATPNALFFASCIDQCSIFGREDAIKLGLLLSAFMNFGGYHSFVETFPIAQSIANNAFFSPLVTAQHQKTLYDAVFSAIKKHAQLASEKVLPYYHLLPS